MFARGTMFDEDVGRWPGDSPDLFPTVRLVICNPFVGMPMIAATRPWGRGLALASLLVLVGGLVDRMSPVSRAMLKYPDLPPFFRSLFTFLISPGWIISYSLIVFPLLFVACAGIYYLCGRLLDGRGSFGSLVATTSFALTPYLLLAAANFILNLFRVPIVGGILALPTLAWATALTVLAIRASLGLTTGRAVLAAFAPFLVVIPVAACAVLALLYAVTSTPSQAGAGQGTTLPAVSATKPDVRTIELATNDLIFDPHSGLLYASVPGSVPGNGNSVVAIDPASGLIKERIAVGSEPNILALSDDGRYLYVGLSGAVEIQRIDLQTRAIDQHIPLVEEQGGSYLATAIAVLPGKAEEIVVGLRPVVMSGIPENVAVYTNGQKRAQLAKPGNFGRSDLFFCGDSTTVYGSDGSFQLNTLAVDSAGVRQVGAPVRIFSSGAQQVRCAGNRLYGSNGEVFDLGSKQLVGTFPRSDRSGSERPGLVYPDAAIERVFFIGVQRVQESAYTLEVYDRQRFTPIATVPIAPIATGDDFSTTLGSRRLVRWGGDGLGFRTKTAIILVRSPYIDGTASAPVSSHPLNGGGWPLGTNMSLLLPVHRSRRRGA